MSNGNRYSVTMRAVLRKWISGTTVAVGLALLVGCAPSAPKHPSPTPTAPIPKPSSHVGPLVNASYSPACGSATIQPNGPTPTPVTLSPGQTVPPFTQPTGPVSASEATSLVHEVLNQQSNISATGQIQCLPPQEVATSELSQFLSGQKNLPDKVWVVIIQGNFTVSNVSSNAPSQPTKYIVYFISPIQPITVYSSFMFASGPLPSPLNSL